MLIYNNWWPLFLWSVLSVITQLILFEVLGTRYVFNNDTKVRMLYVRRILNVCILVEVFVKIMPSIICGTHVVLHEKFDRNLKRRWEGNFCENFRNSWLVLGVPILVKNIQFRGFDFIHCNFTYYPSSFSSRKIEEYYFSSILTLFC